VWAPHLLIATTTAAAAGGGGGAASQVLLSLLALPTEVLCTHVLLAGK
jgi:hypothetical protein